MIRYVVDSLFDDCEVTVTICMREEELFKEWKKKRESFVPDGAVSERDYLKSCPKIAFILKEANDPGDDFDLRQFLWEDGGRWQTWNNVARWVHGIRNLPSECSWSFYEKIDKGFRRQVLRGIVAMNLKKSPGGANTRYADLERVAREDAEYIQKQYSIYNPDITICGGVNTTAEIFQELVHPEMNRKWKQTTRGIWWYRRSTQKCVVAFSHPAVRGQDALLLYALLDAIKEIKEKQERS